MPRKLGEKTLQRIYAVQSKIDALKKKDYPPEYLTCLNKQLDTYKHRIDKLSTYSLDVRPTPNEKKYSSKYIWRTAGDARVCSRCAERDGKIFSWDESLPGGHPGEAPCYRCVALGIIDESKLHEIEPGKFRLTDMKTKNRHSPQKSGCLCIVILGSLLLFQNYARSFPALCWVFFLGDNAHHATN